MTQTVQIDADLRPLTAHDRCDRCGSQAYIEIGTKPTPLLFCGHHYRQHRDVIQSLGIEVTADDLAKIEAEE